MGIFSIWVTLSSLNECIRGIPSYLSPVHISMRFQRIVLLPILLLVAVISCQEKKDYSQAITDGYYFHAAQKQVTEVIIHDIFSPPVAVRIYSYSSLAG